MTNSSARKAFTLVELLVSIVILVILASITLYGMASVQTTAQVQRAKSQIGRIHELLMDRWESYETRSVQTMDLPLPFTANRPQPPAESLRLLGLRELMRFEMPDQAEDIYPTGDGATDGRAVLAQLPPLARYYRRKTRTPGDDPNVHWTYQHQSSECLYLILSSINVGDANALEFFSEDEIQDTDNDGVPEIIDPWGNPILFIRWPSGYSLSSGVTLNEIPDPANPEASTDPFDLLGLESLNQTTDNPGRIPHATVPLVFSAGPDSVGGIFFRLGDYTTTVVERRPSFSSGAATVYWPNDPYATDGGVPAGQVNPERRDASLDNITSHQITSGIK